MTLTPGWSDVAGTASKPVQHVHRQGQVKPVSLHEGANEGLAAVFCCQVNPQGKSLYLHYKGFHSWFMNELQIAFTTWVFAGLHEMQFIVKEKRLDGETYLLYY